MSLRGFRNVSHQYSAPWMYPSPLGWSCVCLVLASLPPFPPCPLAISDEAHWSSRCPWSTPPGYGCSLTGLVAQMILGMFESYASAFLRVPWHQRLRALCGVSHPLHQGDLVDCLAWFLCIGGFSAEILCPPLDAVRVVLVSFSRVLLPLLLSSFLPSQAPRFARISTKALLPPMLRYPGIGPGAQYTPDTLRRWFLISFNHLTCCLWDVVVSCFLFSLCLSCCCSARSLPFPVGLSGWGVPLLPGASDRRLAGCMSSGLPVAFLALCLVHCLCLSPSVCLLLCFWLLLFLSSFLPCVFWWVCVWFPPSPTPSLFAHCFLWCFVILPLSFNRL